MTGKEPMGNEWNMKGGGKEFRIEPSGIKFCVKRKWINGDRMFSGTENMSMIC